MCGLATGRMLFPGKSGSKTSSSNLKQIKFSNFQVVDLWVINDNIMFCCKWVFEKARWLCSSSVVSFCSSLVGWQLEHDQKAKPLSVRRLLGAEGVRKPWSWKDLGGIDGLTIVLKQQALYQMCSLPLKCFSPLGWAVCTAAGCFGIAGGQEWSHGHNPLIPSCQCK